MTASTTPTLERMQALTRQWETARDDRCVFLKCYALMTGNMLAGIDDHRFRDGPWVRTFVDRFAGYYFDALHVYERDARDAPAVWRVAFDSARDPDMWTLQKLLLGINAHINYDLVLTLDELLRTEWPALSSAQRGDRRADYDTVNRVINQTIDAVQDEVLEPAMPMMDWVDRLLGTADERLLSRLLSGWRDEVWQHATALLAVNEATQQRDVLAGVETIALRRAQAIALTDWTALDELV